MNQINPYWITGRAEVPKIVLGWMFGFVMLIISAASYAQTGLIESSANGLTSSAASGDVSSNSAAQQADSEEALFTINFRDADILEVLEAYSNLLNVNVVLGRVCRVSLR